MAALLTKTTATWPQGQAVEAFALYRDGMIAGTGGAATLALWFLLSLWVGKSEVEHDFVLTSKCQKEFSKIKLALQLALDSSDPEPALRTLIGQIAGIVDRHDSGTTRDVAIHWDLTRADIVDDVQRRVQAYVNTFGARWGTAPRIQQKEAA